MSVLFVAGFFSFFFCGFRGAQVQQQQQREQAGFVPCGNKCLAVLVFGHNQGALQS